MSVRRQGVFWILTIPHPNQQVYEWLQQSVLPPGVVYMSGQLERGESTGYLHFQLCVALSRKGSLSTVKRVFGDSCHAELTRSNAALAYCSKEDTRVEGPWQFGICPIARNSKPDWESVWTAAVAGDIMSIPASIRVCSYRTLRSIGADFAKPLAIVRVVNVFWGGTGTGKSRRAWDEAGEGAYSKCPRSKFWDGYTDQKQVVIDEFRGGIDVSHILRWCDRYPVRVDIKGSSRPLLAEVLWFTSNVDPRLWYPELDSETLSALLRRFNITHFP